MAWRDNDFNRRKLRNEGTFSPSWLAFDPPQATSFRHRLLQSVCTKLRIRHKYICDCTDTATELHGKKGVFLVLVLRPGFEPGSATREAAILGRTILPEQLSI